MYKPDLALNNQQCLKTKPNPFIYTFLYTVWCCISFFNDERISRIKVQDMWHKVTFLVYISKQQGGARGIPVIIVEMGDTQPVFKFWMRLFRNPKNLTILSPTMFK